jgi:S1-C subfamily serine protease
MTALVLLWCLPGQIETAPSTDFPRKLQVTAVTATVLVEDRLRGLTGSGVIIGRSGLYLYVLTAGHLVDKGAKLQIQTFSAESYPRPGGTYRSVEVVDRLTTKDLALIRVATRDALPGKLKICPPGEEPRGARFPALAVGCCNGEAPTCELSQVNGKKQVRKLGEERTAPYWELDKALGKGTSGGPLVDKRGFLIGVASLASNGKGYVAHLDSILEVLQRNGLTHLYEPNGK